VSAFAYLGELEREALYLLPNALIMAPEQRELLFEVAPEMRDDILVQSLIERYTQ